MRLDHSPEPPLTFNCAEWVTSMNSNALVGPENGLVVSENTNIEQLYVISCAPDTYRLSPSCSHSEIKRVVWEQMYNLYFVLIQALKTSIL